MMTEFIALPACVGAVDESPPPSPKPEPSSSPVGTSGPLEQARCPVSDDAFCAAAVDVAAALVDRDAERLLELSRSDRIVCADVARESFPECRFDDVLQGYGSGGPDFVIEMLHEGVYRGQLETILGALGPTYSDEFGGGLVRPLGVGDVRSGRSGPQDVPPGVDGCGG